MKKNLAKSYVTGFVLSVILTITSFFAVGSHTLDGRIITIIILGLALLQLVVQLVFFLHLVDESGPRWKLAVFFSTISIVLLVVIASLWIMQHLNYNMTPSDRNNYIFKEEGFHK